MRAHRMSHEPTLTLRIALERALRAGHPWVYRKALKEAPRAAGQVATLRGRDGRFVGRGITEEGPIALRMFTTREEPVDAQLFSKRLASAWALRQRVIPAETSAYRLVHGEGDRLPGLVVDIYGTYAVLRFDSPALYSWLPAWLTALTPHFGQVGVRGAVARIPKKKGFGVEHVWGDRPPDPVTVTERGMNLVASLWHGQKTGLFLDHRDSRWRARTLSKERRALNLYGYTGGFSVAAGLGGATEVVTIDSARPALELAVQTWRANGLEPHRHRVEASDVASFMHGLDDGERFDVVIADPPSFASSEAAVPDALGAYAKLHESCLRHLSEGGFYLAASCSSHVTADAFELTLKDAAKAARSVVQVVDSWGAAPDHPVLLAFPEGKYLKVYLLRLLS